ncbi:MAG: alpha/beta fold hydrolase [Mycobacterium sp.]
MDLPGFGLTDPVDYRAQPFRPLVVEFLAQVLEGIGLQCVPFVTQSQGSLWSTWLSLDRPGSVTAQVMVACPAHILGTSAPLPMRTMSIPAIGRALLKLQAPSPRQVDRVFAMVHEHAAQREVRDLLLACERLPAYAESFVGLLAAVMRFGRVRPEIALTRQQLAQVAHPVQMIWGDNDPFGSPATARRAVDFLRDGELHFVPGGHAPWFGRAEQVGELAVRFLREHRTNGG